MPKDVLRQRLLKAVAPDHPTEKPARWQQQKSALTRQRLIDAAVACLVDCGYAGFSTAAVAERGGFSRGTMHHHFATRLDLVTAVIEHVFYHRMHSFLEEYALLAAKDGGEYMVEAGSEAHWHSMQSPDYAAYVELAAAARTDAELRAVFEPAAQRFDQVWTEEMVEAFPQWQRHRDAMKLASDLTIAAHTGLIMNSPVFGQERTEAVRALVARMARSLHA